MKRVLAVIAVLVGGAIEPPAPTEIELPDGLDDCDVSLVVTVREGSVSITHAGTVFVTPK